MSAENTLTVRLVECAKTAAQWAALLTIPKRGEICLEMENQGTNENPDLLFKMKIGDGIHTYANLNYFPVDDNIAQVVANWVEQNLDVNEYAQASYDNSTKTLSVYGIKEVDGKIVKGTNHVDIQLAEGTKIDITSAAGVITIAHEATTRTDTTKSSAGFGTNVVTGVTTDQTGHVTGVETGPLPTKPATKNVIGTSDAATTDGASANPYLNHIEDGDVKSHHQLIGGTQVDVNSDASGNVTIKHKTISRTDQTTSSQPSQLVTVVTTSNGHVTSVTTINPDDLKVGLSADLDTDIEGGFKAAAIAAINWVNNWTTNNPVKAGDLGHIAVYNGNNQVIGSDFSPSDATIVPGATGNNVILPSVRALVAYVQSVAQNALHYQGTVATVASLPSTGTTTGDVYILSATDGDYDAGDWFVRNKANTGWDVVQGRVRVTNRAATLTPDGGTKNIANVEGTEITVVMPDLNFAEPAASGDTLTVIDTISQSNGKILATKKNVQSASKSQKGVVQFVTDIHGSSDQTKGVTAADAWTEFGKRNVKAVEVDTVDSIETSSTTQEVIAEGLADLDARVLGIEASIKNGFTSLEVGELVVGYALFARIRRGDFILKGAGAPSASVVPVDWNEEKYGEWTGIPLYEGQIYIDTTNKIAYMAVGVSAVTDWKRITNA